MMPASLSRYQKGRILAKGTFGVVRVAFDQGVEVAIKEIQVKPIDIDEVELQVSYLKKCIGDHTVECIDGFYDRSVETFNLVMEMCEQNLRDRIKKHSKFDSKLLISLITQITSAFLVLDTHNLMHLDLKPENILIKGGNYFKICDFGCSQEARGTVFSRFQNPTFGTPNYLAPEHVFLSTLQYNRKSSDIWSFGVILYQIVYGKIPFKELENGQIDREMMEIFIKKQESIAYPPCPSMPIELIKRMLIIQPNGRITWRQLRKVLMKQYGVEKVQFENVRTFKEDHVTVCRVLIEVVLLIRLNLDVSQHPFWKQNRPTLIYFEQILVHLAEIYCLKFEAVVGYKAKYLLSGQAINRLNTLSTYVHLEEEQLTQKKQIKNSQLQDQFYYQQMLKSLLTELFKVINERMYELWGSVQVIRLFCYELREVLMSGKALFCNRAGLQKTIQKLQLARI